MTWARAPKALNNIPYCLQKTIFPRSTSLDIWKAKNRLKYGGESASHLYSRLVSHICSIHKYSLKCHRAVLQINVVTVGLYGETGSIQHWTPAILRNTFPVALTGPDLPHLTEENIFNLHTYSGKDKSGQRKKSFICAVLGFFLTEKEINVATPLDANLHRRKKKKNYVKWNQPNKKWKLDVFTVQSSHHLWNAKCYSQETGAQLLHVLSDCTRALWAEKSVMKSIFLTNGFLYKLPGRVAVALERTQTHKFCSWHLRHVNAAFVSPREESISHVWLCFKQRFKLKILFGFCIGSCSFPWNVWNIIFFGGGGKLSHCSKFLHQCRWVLMVLVLRT